MLVLGFGIAWLGMLLVGILLCAGRYSQLFGGQCGMVARKSRHGDFFREERGGPDDFISHGGRREHGVLFLDMMHKMDMMSTGRRDGCLMF